MAATHHLALRPKSDLSLFYGLARLLIQRGWIDEEFIAAHTTGFDEFCRHVQEYSLELTAERTGLRPQHIEELAQLIHSSDRVSLWWTMGVNQSYEGVRTAQSIINLALITGNIGRPGTGANSITGQCNAMGSRLFSNTSQLFGGREFTDPTHRAEVAQLLDLPLDRIPHTTSWTYHEILKGILDGKIKGLWIIATNPAHSWINQDQARDILSRLDFLVVQDMYVSTETAQLAHLLFPAAGWGEKEGTFINSERRVGLVKPVAKAPGQALSDFRIFQLVAKACGVGHLFREWTSPRAVFQILKRLSAGRPCDITGIDDYEHIERAGGIQWPYPRTTEACQQADSFNSAGFQERRLFADGQFFHPDGRARLLYEDPRPMPEPPNRDFPFVLLTGRGTAVQWHTQTRTGKSPVLNKLAPAALYVELNPADARRLDIHPQDVVIVESRRAAVEATAFLTPTVQPGQVFLPMHYVAANRLTDAVFDPYSKQPSYKACAVRLRKRR